MKPDTVQIEMGIPSVDAFAESFVELLPRWDAENTTVNRDALAVVYERARAAVPLEHVDKAHGFALTIVASFVATALDRADKKGAVLT